jgi:hypothetical protein
LNAASLAVAQKLVAELQGEKPTGLLTGVRRNPHYIGVFRQKV